MDSKKLLDILDSRIVSITETKDLLEKALADTKKDLRKSYYSEVAFFVHAIWDNYELSLLFNELLSYRSKLTLKKEYADSINKIEESIKKISVHLLSHEKFTEFEKSYDNGWKNPFEGNALYLMLRDLLMKFCDIEKNKVIISYNNIFSLFYNLDGTNGIINKFISKYPSGFDTIKDELGVFSTNLNVLFYFDQFYHDYLGVNSAVQLQQIYRGLHPLCVSENISESIFSGIINSGDDTREADRLLSHCKRVRDYLKQKLDSKFSIDVSIGRFKSYMEIFYNRDSLKFSEAVFQKEFELFMFNNGYFALSQGHLGNGRFDNIVINDNNAFLCEHKQIGFGDKKETKKAQIRKFQSSKIQSKIYHDRLRFYPDLSPVIYILIVSNFYLRFKNNICDIEREGLYFKFRLICLEKDAPTKIKNIEEIDIEKIIK